MGISILKIRTRALKRVQVLIGSLGQQNIQPTLQETTELTYEIYTDNDSLYIFNNTMTCHNINQPRFMDHDKKNKVERIFPFLLPSVNISICFRIINFKVLPEQ